MEISLSSWEPGGLVVLWPFLVHQRPVLCHHSFQSGSITLTTPACTSSSSSQLSSLKFPGENYSLDHSNCFSGKTSKRAVAVSSHCHSSFHWLWSPCAGGLRNQLPLFWWVVTALMLVHLHPPPTLPPLPSEKREGANVGGIWVLCLYPAARDFRMVGDEGRCTNVLSR